jgi:hypothetical protein
MEIHIIQDKIEYAKDSRMLISEGRVSGPWGHDGGDVTIKANFCTCGLLVFLNIHPKLFRLTRYLITYTHYYTICLAPPPPTHTHFK